MLVNFKYWNNWWKLGGKKFYTIANADDIPYPNRSYYVFEGKNLATNVENAIGNSVREVIISFDDPGFDNIVSDNYYYLNADKISFGPDIYPLDNYATCNISFPLEQKLIPILVCCTGHVCISTGILLNIWLTMGPMLIGIYATVC